MLRVHYSVLARNRGPQRPLVQPDLYRRVQFHGFRTADHFPFRRETHGVAALQHRKRAECIESVSNLCKGLVRAAQSKLHGAFHSMLQNLDPMPAFLNEISRPAKPFKPKPEVVHTLRQPLQLSFRDGKSSRTDLRIQEVPHCPQSVSQAALQTIGKILDAPQ